MWRNGRRKRLKIARETMWVRVPPSAPWRVFLQHLKGCKNTRFLYSEFAGGVVYDYAFSCIYGHFRDRQGQHRWNLDRSDAVIVDAKPLLPYAVDLLRITVHTRKIIAMHTMAWSNQWEVLYAPILSQTVPQSHVLIVSLLVWICRTPNVDAATTLTNLLYKPACNKNEAVNSCLSTPSY